jgi:hypothetical protein
MPLQKWGQHGRLVASRARTLRSSPMERFGARQPRNCSRMNTAERRTGACALCMEPACAVVVPGHGTEQCQWQGSKTAKPRQVSVLLHPLAVGSAPLLWRDWSRREHRRACMHLLRHQRIEISCPPTLPPSKSVREPILSRAQRAHTRLSWEERLACNRRAPTANRVTIKLFGIPEGFASWFGRLPA